MLQKDLISIYVTICMNQTGLKLKILTVKTLFVSASTDIQMPTT